jgi:hypothetical protein
MRRVLVSFIILLFLLNMLAPAIPIANAALPSLETVDPTMKATLGPTERAPTPSSVTSASWDVQPAASTPLTVQPVTLASSHIQRLAQLSRLSPFPLAFPQGDPWLDPDWQYRKSITIDHTKVSANLTDFPVLVDITDSELGSKARTDGNDIVFTASSGNDKLNHEIESYTSPSGHLVAWVNVPGLSSTVDTVLYMYYGNPSAANQQNGTSVWDSDFKMVQHLSETSGTQHDSTANGNDGTASGGVTQGTAGKIGGADNFDGASGVVNFNNIPSLGITDKITFEAWIRPDSLPGSAYWNIFMKGIEPNVPYQFYLESSTGNLNYYYSSVHIVSSGVAVTSGTWQHIAISVDSPSNTARFYINGNLVATKTGSLGPDNGGPAQLGAFTTYGCYFRGMMDEARISRMVRSATWILTEYNNQKDSSSFYTIGGEESSSGGPSISNPSPSNGATNVPITVSQLGFKISDYQGHLMNYSASITPNVGGGSGSNVGDGVYNVPVSGLQYSTAYTWFVNVTDGTYSTNATYHFATQGAIAIDLQSPADGTTTFDNEPDFRFTATHLSQPTFSCSLVVDGGTLVSCN